MKGMDVSELVESLHWLEIERENGEISGYTVIGVELNLNALAIGLGLANIAYEPDKFPGLVYLLDGYEMTVLIFDSGKIAFFDATDRQAAVQGVNTVIDRLMDLGLIQATSVKQEAEENLSITDTIPVPTKGDVDDS